MSSRLRFTLDPATFLRAAGGYLNTAPVLCSVVASVAQREAATGRESLPGSPHWYLTVHDDSGAVVGAAMRTSPDPPHPPFLLPMPDDDARELARTLGRRGEQVAGANGALPAVRSFATEVAQLVDGTVEVAVATRLFELTELINPRPVRGALRAARSADVDLVCDWLGRFHADADAQAGRRHGTAPSPNPALVRTRIAAGHYWLWCLDERPVNLSGLNPVSFGAQRIGPVYTPPENRGQGWASAAVAQLSRQALAAGARPCLFTDQDNPVSNHVYIAIGFKPVADMVNLTITSDRFPTRTVEHGHR